MKRNKKIIKIYCKLAKYYHLASKLYYIIGFREEVYREKAIKMMCLKKGDSVVDLCCGTGLNFGFLQQAIGPKGKIIGVDITDSMLKQARKKIEKNDWRNVELVHSDIADFKFPKRIGGVLSTYGISFSPDYDFVIKNASKKLLPGKRCVVLDFAEPKNIFKILMPLAVFIMKPFGISKKTYARFPWKSIKKYFKKFIMKELYLGFCYIAIGEN